MAPLPAGFRPWPCCCSNPPIASCSIARRLAAVFCSAKYWKRFLNAPLSWGWGHCACWARTFLLPLASGLSAKVSARKGGQSPAAEMPRPLAALEGQLLQPYPHRAAGPESGELGAQRGSAAGQLSASTAGMARLTLRRSIADASRRLELKALKRKRVERCGGGPLWAGAGPEAGVGGSRGRPSGRAEAPCAAPTAAQRRKPSRGPCAALEAPPTMKGACAQPTSQATAGRRHRVSLTDLLADPSALARPPTVFLVPGLSASAGGPWGLKAAAADGACLFCGRS